MPLSKNLKFFLEHFTIIFILTLAILNLQTYFNNSQKTLSILGTSVDTSEIIKEKDYWVEIVSKNPSYIDGWLELYKLETLLGNVDKATGALNTAISINPNYPKLPRF